MGLSARGSGRFRLGMGCLAAGLLPLLFLGALLLRTGEPRADRAAPSSENDEAWSALVLAARTGDAERIRELLATGADGDAPGGGNGWTPLLHAVHTRNSRGVRALLVAGVDPNARGARGQLPLLMAASYGEAGLVGLLLDAGADPKLGGQGWRNALEAALTGSLDFDGLTFTRCQPQVVRSLVTRHPDLASGGPMGRLGRFFAYARGCEEIERLVSEPAPGTVVAPE